MSITVAGVQTFTDAEMLILVRNALVQLTISQATTINGRSITRAQIPQLKELHQWLEQRIQDDANSSQAGGNIALAQFGEPV